MTVFGHIGGVPHTLVIDNASGAGHRNSKGEVTLSPRVRGVHRALPEYLTCWGPGLLRLGAIMSFGGYCVSRPGLLRWEPWLVRLLSPCEGRVVKGVTSNGTKNTGETGAAFACQGLSGRAIARSQGMSRRSVSDVLDAARAVGVGWDDVAGKTDGEVYALLFPGRGERESVYEQPDWARVHRELARVGVTLRILHGEYADGCRRTGKPHMGYDRSASCTPHTCRSWGVTSRVEHKAGRTIEVDWAGKTLRIVDPVTGIRQRRICSWPCCRSVRYAFVEPTLGHGAELVAAGPRGDVRVVRRFHAPPGVRQSEDRRHRASARGRGSC